MRNRIGFQPNHISRSALLRFIRTEPDENNIIKYLDENSDLFKSRYLNLPCSSGNYLLYEVARLQKPTIVAKLILMGADPNCQNGKFGETPLHYSAKFGDLETTKALIAGGARIDAGDYTNMTPLHLACKFKQDNVAEYLIERKANINARNNKRQKAIDFAAQSDNLAMVKKLIRNGAKLDGVNPRPLYVSIEIKHKLLKHQLRQRGAVFALPTSRLYTPEMVLSAHTFSENINHGLQAVGLYLELQTNPEFKLLIQAMALICLAQPKTSITLVNSQNLNNYHVVKDGLLSGQYNHKNSLSVASAPYTFLGCIIHEMIHLVCAIVFKNNLCPYKNDDEISKKQYQMAISSTLMQLHDLFPDIAIPNTNIQIDDDTAQLIHLDCSNGEVSASSSWDTGAKLYSASARQQSPVRTILNAYNPTYKSSDEHSEILVRYFQSLYKNDDQVFRTALNPLREFVENYFMPALQEFVDNHPCKSKLQLEAFSTRYERSKNTMTWADIVRNGKKRQSSSQITSSIS